jgi:O-methyltransferase
LKKTLIRINAFVKGLVLLVRPHIFLGWLRSPFFFLSNTLSLTKWIAQHQEDEILNDFYTTKRIYSRRFDLYNHVSDKYDLKNRSLDYIEFGVAAGHSFRWWVEKSKNADSRFYGFDTFEGLPEAWGTFSKSDMASSVPVIDDSRVRFYKGLFQESLPGFLNEWDKKDDRLTVIHFDADLFSSTLFALTAMAPYMKRGDILLFDEFNVPNHEFLAFKIFSESYYVKTRLLGAVNNYLQVAFVIE